MKARTLFFRGFITKKRSQIKGRYLVFRNLYLIDLEENAPREEICSHGEVSAVGLAEVHVTLGTDCVG